MPSLMFPWGLTRPPNTTRTSIKTDVAGFECFLWKDSNMWNSNGTSADKYTISLYKKTAWDCRVYMDEPHENVQDHILASQNKNCVLHKKN